MTRIATVGLQTRANILATIVNSMPAELGDAATLEMAIDELIERGVQPDSDGREPWFLCEAHTKGCLGDTLERFERAVDITIRKMSDAA